MMVNPADFDGILTQEIINRVCSAGVLWLFAVTVLIFEIIQIEKAKYNKKKAKYNKREIKYDIIVLDIILIIGLPMLSYIRVLPIINDISNQTVECIAGYYQTGPIEKETLLNTAYISAQIGDEKMELKIPMGKQRCFPREDCPGTFWYAKDSLILLMFIADDGTVYIAK